MSGGCGGPLSGNTAFLLVFKGLGIVADWKVTCASLKELVELSDLALFLGNNFP